MAPGRELRNFDYRLPGSFDKDKWDAQDTSLARIKEGLAMLGVGETEASALVEVRATWTKKVDFDDLPDYEKRLELAMKLRGKCCSRWYCRAKNAEERESVAKSPYLLISVIGGDLLTETGHERARQGESMSMSGATQCDVPEETAKAESGNLPLPPERKFSADIDSGN
jgi:hypothetical protein